MDLDEYQKNAIRTANVNQSDDLALANWALGLAGEAGEVLELMLFGSTLPSEKRFARLQEELGDVFWYIAVMCEQLGVKMSALDGNIDSIEYPSDNSVFMLTLSACGLADSIKKVVFHKKNLDKELIGTALKNAYAYCCYVCNDNYINIQEALIQNINKLKKRYPDGWPEVA